MRRNTFAYTLLRADLSAILHCVQCEIYLWDWLFLMYGPNSRLELIRRGRHLGGSRKTELSKMGN